MTPCNKCMGVCGSILLILGILFLLRDLNVWDFWNIQWWSALLIVFGLGHLCMKKCPDCQKGR
mgnify:CR=1